MFQSRRAARTQSPVHLVFVRAIRPGDPIGLPANPSVQSGPVDSEDYDVIEGPDLFQTIRAS